MSVEEFVELSEGHTLHFQDRFGDYAGGETFFEGQQTIWQYSDGTCTRGEWWAEGDAICFVYDLNPEPQCWRMIEDGTRILARLRDATDPFGDLILTRRTAVPLTCDGPFLGA